MITNQFYPLLATLLKDQSQGDGAFYMAVGEGEGAWDQQASNPNRNINQMANELHRKLVDMSSIVYLDNGNNLSETPTARLQVSNEFLAGEGTGTLRECALFGGQASEAPGSGTLLSYFTHLRIEKTDEMDLQRTIVLDLNPRAVIAQGHQSRYLGNAVSEELHDLENEKGGCQIGELRIDRRAYFETPEHAINLGYDYCGHCFGKELSTR